MCAWLISEVHVTVRVTGRVTFRVTVRLRMWVMFMVGARSRHLAGRDRPD